MNEEDGRRVKGVGGRERMRGEKERKETMRRGREDNGEGG